MRFNQSLLIGSTLALTWLGSMALHEAGHVIHALASGGKVTQVELHPLRFSYTHVSPNPSPQFVAWGGLLWGSLLPLALLALSRILRLRAWYVARFVAGGCCVMNGTYAALGWALDAGDARDLVVLGTPPWVLMLLGALAVAGGLSLWHNLGAHFGLRPFREPDRRVALGTAAVLVILVVLELFFGVSA